MPIESRKLVVKAAIESGVESIAARVTDGRTASGVNTLVAANGVELARMLIVRGLHVRWNGRFVVEGLAEDDPGARGMAGGDASAKIPAAVLRRDIARGGLIRARVPAVRVDARPRKRPHVIQAGRG